MNSKQPGKYVPPSSRAKLQKATKITELRPEDFPEFISVSKATNSISQKPSYASLLKPKAPVVEEDKPIIVSSSSVRKTRLVDMVEPPYKDDDDYLTQTMDFTKYYKLRNIRLQQEEKRRNERAFDHSSDEENCEHIQEDNLSELYDGADEEDDDESLDNYDPSEFDRHK
jgi:TPP-dependent indolepyruvate ferredoxin oxidoreductase alpha subunit